MADYLMEKKLAQEDELKYRQQSGSSSNEIHEIMKKKKVEMA